MRGCISAGQGAARHPISPISALTAVLFWGTSLGPFDVGPSAPTLGSHVEHDQPRAAVDSDRLAVADALRGVHRTKTVGIPDSRATRSACATRPPPSETTAAARARRGVHDRVVALVTSDLPARS